MFQGKSVLVTGSARNTGWGIARVFGRYGATVFVNGRSAPQVEQVTAELNRQYTTPGARFVATAGDIAHEEEVARMFAIIQRECGSLDVLVNNACHLGLGYSFLDTPIAFFDEVMAANLRGAVLCAQYAARQMVAKRSGAIVNIGSNTSDRTIPDRSAYIASKGALASLTRAMALELAPLGVRVNSVVPGYIRTERWDTLAEAVKQRRWKNTPTGKESTADDVGEAAAFLASSKAGNITGASLVVDGGVYIQDVPSDCAV